MNCRFDNLPLTQLFVDLGFSPPSNAFLKPERLEDMECFYPLKAFVSERTFLVQIAEYKKAEEIFHADYVYHSSYSTTWLSHVSDYVNKVVERFSLDKNSFVVELASNDGYLLQYVKAKGIPCLGVEPSASVAAVAGERGIDTAVEFFGVEFAGKFKQQGKRADLVVANNVLAHVPDLNDFVEGVRLILNKNGVFTAEFPHLRTLVEHCQFDTIYHEHYWYFSLHAIEHVLNAHGLVVFDVEEIPTHGGSLRIFVAHKGSEIAWPRPRVAELKARERAAGMLTLDYYTGFQKRVETVKYSLLRFLLDQRAAGNLVVGYGAAAKGNTLLNYAGVKSDLVRFVADASPHKQGRFMPGTHIPVVGEKQLRAVRPAFVLILPWNLRGEIVKQLSYIHEWGGQFVVAIPDLAVF